LRKVHKGPPWANSSSSGKLGHQPCGPTDSGQCHTEADNTYLGPQWILNRNKRKPTF
jgi:hypothetical protein